MTGAPVQGLLGGGCSGRQRQWGRKEGGFLAGGVGHAPGHDSMARQVPVAGHNGERWQGASGPGGGPESCAEESETQLLIGEESWEDFRQSRARLGKTPA